MDSNNVIGCPEIRSDSLVKNRIDLDQNYFGKNSIRNSIGVSLGINSRSCRIEFVYGDKSLKY